MTKPTHLDVLGEVRSAMRKLRRVEQYLSRLERQQRKEMKRRAEEIAAADQVRALEAVDDAFTPGTSGR